MTTATAKKATYPGPGNPGPATERNGGALV